MAAQINHCLDRICATKPEARDVEAELFVELKGKVAHAEQHGLAPATVKGLFEAYVADLESRGKSPGTVSRAAVTALAVQTVFPALLDKAVGAVTDADISEIRLLRREDVRLEQGAILLPQAKAGARPVVRSQDAQKVLRMQPEAHDQARVFPSPAGAPYTRVAISGVFRKAARAAGLKGFRFHTSGTTGRQWRPTRDSRRPS